MHRNDLLDMMREDYRRRDLASLKRHFTMGHWLLTPDDAKKIKGAISTLEKTIASDPVIQEALRLLGGRIVT